MAQPRHALARYGSVMGLEAFTPIRRQTLFLYVDDGRDGGQDPLYNRRVARAISRGARTQILEAYRRLAREQGTIPWRPASAGRPEGP